MVFWIIILFTVVAVLQTLQLENGISASRYFLDGDWLHSQVAGCGNLQVLG